MEKTPVTETTLAMDTTARVSANEAGRNGNNNGTQESGMHFNGE